MTAKLVKGTEIREKILDEIEEEVKKELQEAIDFTEKSPYPSLEEIYTDLTYEERRAV